MTSLSRRELLKTSLASTTAAAIGLPVSRAARAQAAAAEQNWQWDKAVCRFCGTGCGIQVATHEGRVVATKGDPAAPVNKGLNCIKGYFNGKILYGADRLTQPLMRMPMSSQRPWQVRISSRGCAPNLAMSRKVPALAPRMRASVTAIMGGASKMM